MFCSKCGNENAEGTKFCAKCGASMMPAAAAGNDSAAVNAPSAKVRYPKKKKGLAIGLWFAGVFGFLNIHNFYLGKVAIGVVRLVVYIASMSMLEQFSSQMQLVAQLVVMGLLVWNIIDFVKIIRTPREEFGKSGQKSVPQSAEQNINTQPAPLPAEMGSAGEAGETLEPKTSLPSKLKNWISRNRKAIVCCLLAVALLVGGFFAFGYKPYRYWSAEQILDGEGYINYKKAIEIFDSLGDYRDAPARAEELRYLDYLRNHEAIISIHVELFNMSLSYGKLQEALDTWEKLLEMSKEAANSEVLKLYIDALNKVTYTYANYCMEHGVYQTALELFESLDDYEDSKDKALECEQAMK